LQAESDDLEVISCASAAYGVLKYYHDILEELSRGLVRAAVAYAGIPKLTDNHFSELCSIKDAASARMFVNIRPELADFIVIEQVVFGPDFWRLLFAWATLRLKAQPSLKRTTVVAAEFGPTPRRLCKVIPLSDGGFSITAPYHNAQSGSLFKAPRIREPGTSYVPFSELVPFMASDRVKLSYHADGFVQFSGEDSRKIRSGIENGVPKGLGLKTNPLNRPVQSGPSIGCMIWGYDHFAPWVRRADEAALLFGPGDFYSEPSGSEDRQDCCALSFFVFPADQLEDAVGPVDTGDELSMRLPMNIYHRQSAFCVKLIRVSPRTVLGVIALQGKCGHEAPSGFLFSSPSDKEHCLLATYPPFSGFERAESLDYQIPT
jgi:hypothetical protein